LNENKFKGYLKIEVVIYIIAVVIYIIAVVIYILAVRKKQVSSLMIPSV